MFLYKRLFTHRTILYYYTNIWAVAIEFHVATISSARREGVKNSICKLMLCFFRKPDKNGYMNVLLVL